MNLRHLLLAGVSFATAPPANGAAAPSSPAAAAAPTSKSLDGRRILQSEPEADPTYDAITSLQDGTASIQSSCYVAAPPRHDEVMVWCDIYVPIGLEVKAEIRAGTCDAFTDVAGGDSYWLGVASPVFLPEVSDEEKEEGTFAHSYCARMDVLDDADGTGDAVSVFERRFPMEVTYNYYGEVDGDGDVVDGDQTTHTDDGAEKEPLATTAITIDMSGAYEWVNGQTGGEIGGESSSSSAASKNENAQDNTNTDAGSSTAVYIGLSVLAGAIILFSLGAIIVWEKKRSSRKRREWAETQTMGSDDANEHHATGYDPNDEAAFGHFMNFLFADKNDREAPKGDKENEDSGIEVPLEGVPNAQ